MSLRPVLLVMSAIAVIAALAVGRLSPLVSDVHATERFESADYTLSVETVASGLAHPWGMAMLPGGELLVSERGGKLWLVRDGSKAGPVRGLPDIAVGGQGGLLDVALDPDFASNNRIFFTFADPAGGARGTALASAELVTGFAPRLRNVRTVFSMDGKTGSGHHFGSRIAFAPDGNVFITIGDRGDRNRAQDPFDHAGSVLRLRPDGSVPPDNPSPDGAQAAAHIWSIGHRNPQGAAINPDTGRLWTVEHGARGGDEINRPDAGRNYGWPVISYGRHYSGAKIGNGTHADGMEQPVHYWDPSIAPSGLAFVSGELFPAWRGDLLVGALKDQMLVRLDMEGGTVVGEERLLKRAYGRIRDVRVFADGAIWLLTDEANGKLLRITPGG